MGRQPVSAVGIDGFGRIGSRERLCHRGSWVSSALGLAQWRKHFGYAVRFALLHLDLIGLGWIGSRECWHSRRNYEIGVGSWIKRPLRRRRGFDIQFRLDWQSGKVQGCWNLVLDIKCPWVGTLEEALRLCSLSYCAQVWDGLAVRNVGTVEETMR